MGSARARTPTRGRPRGAQFRPRLRDAGLRKGDKVVFFSENRPEWIVAFWGCLLDGVVVVPIDYRSSPDFLAARQPHRHAKLVLVGQDVPPLRRSRRGARLAAARCSTRRRRRRGCRRQTRRRSPRDDVAEIIFTSGATAEPKGVVITHRNVLANIVPVEREVLKYRKWGRPFFPLRFLNLLPLSHMFGQAMATFIPPMLPGVVVFMRGYNPAEIVAQIKTRRISVLVSVPKILDVLREHVGRASRAGPTNGASERVARQSHILIRTLRRWWRHRQRPPDVRLEVLGVRRRRRAARSRARGVLGRAGVCRHPGLRPHGNRADRHAESSVRHQTRIGRQGDRRRRGEDRAGRRNPRARRERHDRILQRAAGAAAAFEDGWFHTGDVGEIGADGQLFIRGRKKEMIVTPEGLNVFPEDVERVLNHLPGVRDSAVVGARRNGTGAGARRARPRSGRRPRRRRAAGQRAGSPTIRRSGAALVWPERGAAADRRHAQAQARGDSRMGRRAADRRRNARQTSDALVDAGREVRRPRAISRRPRRSRSWA